jgi:hypothetical protein
MDKTDVGFFIFEGFGDGISFKFRNGPILFNLSLLRIVHRYLGLKHAVDESIIGL